jgi:hypothetical protein
VCQPLPLGAAVPAELADEEDAFEDDDGFVGDPSEVELDDESEDDEDDEDDEDEDATWSPEPDAAAASPPFVLDELVLRLSVR